MLIKEMFQSIQGEGTRIGIPSLFIRTAGCNLNCRWCDTNWIADEHSAIDDKEIRKAIDVAVMKEKIENIVITGGEPTMQEDIFKVVMSSIKGMANRNIHVEIETNIFEKRSVKILKGVSHPVSDSFLHFNLSPKFGVVDYTEEEGYAQEFHKFLVSRRKSIIIKLVVEGISDLQYQLRQLRKLTERVDKSQIFVQPINMNKKIIQELAAHNFLGYRFSIQAHKIIGVK